MDLFEDYERELRNRRNSLRQRENDARREREAVERDMERRCVHAFLLAKVHDFDFDVCCFVASILLQSNRDHG